MSIALRTALARFLRIALFGGTATLAGYLLTATGLVNLGEIGVPTLLIPLATAIIGFLDKFARERLKAETGG